MLPESIDFIEWDASGLLLRVTGFFGTLVAFQSDNTLNA
jgi:hypothetical protein